MAERGKVKRNKEEEMIMICRNELKATKNIARVSLILCMVMASFLIVSCSWRCKTVVIPDSDETRPLAELMVFLPDGEIITVKPGDAPVKIPFTAEDEVVVVVSGKDEDGGVKEVRLTGGSTKVCETDGVREKTFPLRTAIKETSSAQGPGDKTCIQLLLDYTVEGKYAKCRTEGSKLVLYEHSLGAEVENFFGLISMISGVTIFVEP